VGDTVRRPRGTHSAFVSRLLRHLEAIGFDGAPRALGHDEQGRDILGWIDGFVPDELSFHGDETLQAAASLIRRYHDATAGFAAADDARRIVCHNDLSPCNFVFRDRVPVAIIDFDAAAPGTRAHDLGYAAWLWLDIGNEALAASEQMRRLAVFRNAYGAEISRGEIIAAMLERQRQLSAQGRANGNAAMAQWAEDCRAWVQRNFVLW
jgi:aminoglycoside phosphotransferase (APT) family kinase protein